MEFAHSLRSILGLLISPKISALDELRKLTLKEVSIPPVTVDGEASLIRLEHMTHGISWTHVYGSSPELQPVKDAISAFISIENTYDEHFDFKKLQSFSASKSFMTWSERANASKYIDALEWGQNMWEGDNLAFTTDLDFQNNIAHLMGEGIGSSGEINVSIYAWHDERILWSNSGGSHHGAALIRQMHTQNREFYCKAKITRYSINKHVLTTVLDDFYLLIVDDDCLKGGEKYYLSLALSDMDIHFSTCSLPIRSRNYQLLVIPKKQDVVTKNALDTWIAENIADHRMLDFVQFVLKNHK